MSDETPQETTTTTTTTTTTQIPNKPQVHWLVLFFGGLTGRMGFASQRTVAWSVDAFIYSAALISYLIGWYYQRFSLVAYGVLIGGSIAFVLFVPNWSAAVRSARAGRLVDLEEEMEVKFLPNQEVRDYYAELRRDEMVVDPTKRAPMRFKS